MKFLLLTAALALTSSAAMAQEHRRHDQPAPPAAQPEAPQPPAAQDQPMEMDHSQMDHAQMDHGQMDHGQMAGMEGADHDMGQMSGALGSYSLTREASGTSWQPDASKHSGVHGSAGGW